MIYLDTLDDLAPYHLHSAFFAGWSAHPDAETHWRILQGSYRIWLAYDEDESKIVGFINAISDGVLSAFIPLLEVVPAYQGQQIGTRLVEKMLTSLAHLYSIDLICDEDTQPFYARHGFTAYSGMVRRHYHNQTGKDLRET